MFKYAFKIVSYPPLNRKCAWSILIEISENETATACKGNIGCWIIFSKALI